MLGVYPSYKSYNIQKLPRIKQRIRKPGTGCISQINDHLWEGRYSPTINGKRVAKNVYAHSQEECEVMLGEMIKTLKIL